MKPPMHNQVVDLIHKAVGLMDDLLRYRMDVDEYASRLKELDVDSILATHREDFKKDAKLVYYLEALMILSSLQHELDYQVAEYGFNVASEDLRMLKELMDKFSKSGA